MSSPLSRLVGSRAPATARSIVAPTRGESRVLLAAATTNMSSRHSFRRHSLSSSTSDEVGTLTKQQRYDSIPLEEPTWAKFPDGSRFWKSNHGRLQRPIFVAATRQHVGVRVLVREFDCRHAYFVQTWLSPLTTLSLHLVSYRKQHVHWLS